MSKNTEVRKKIKAINVHQWEVAEEIGISEYTLVVWLRKPLIGERLERVQTAIQRIEARRGK